MRNPLFYLICLGFSLAGCTGFIPDSPVISFHNNNSLLPEIEFKTKESSEVIVEYWPENQPIKIQKSKPSIGTDHHVILLNVTPVTEYKFIIKDSNKNESKVYTFSTQEIPPQVLTLKKIKTDTSLFKGYILVRRFFKSGADVLINNEGEIVWYNLYDTAVRRPFIWTDHQTILSIYDTARVVETNLLGELILDLDLAKVNIPAYVHHEILYDKNEDIITLTSDSAILDLRKFGGEKLQSFRGSGIIRFNKKGEILWKWSLVKNIDPTTLINKTTNLKDMLGHANSIAICDDGNYLVSFRDFSQVWKINSTDGTVMWRLGKGGDFKMDEHAFFIGQHSAHFNDLGHVMMFDNGEYHSRKDSRVLSLSIDEKNKTAKAETIISLPKFLSSYRMCSAYKIDDDKYLVCTTKKDMSLVIMNGKGEILWRVSGDNASYRAYYIENPFINWHLSN